MLLNNEICCSMLVRAINGKTQFKEIIGIVHDIRSISSRFSKITFSRIFRLENSIADGLAKTTLYFFLQL